MPRMIGYFWPDAWNALFLTFSNWSEKKKTTSAKHIESIRPSVITLRSWFNSHLKLRVSRLLVGAGSASQLVSTNDCFHIPKVNNRINGIQHTYQVREKNSFGSKSSFKPIQSGRITLSSKMPLGYKFQSQTNPIYATVLYDINLDCQIFRYSNEHIIRRMSAITGACICINELSCGR